MKIITVKGCDECPLRRTCDVWEALEDHVIPIPTACPLVDLEKVQSDAFQAGVNEVFSQKNVSQ